MRAADNRVGHDGRARCVSLEKAQNLLSDKGIVANVHFTLGEPALEKIRLVTFGQENADDDFGGQFVVGSVESRRGNGIASKSRAELPVQPRSSGSSLLGRSLLLHQCNIRRVPTYSNNWVLSVMACFRKSDFVNQKLESLPSRL